MRQDSRFGPLALALAGVVFAVALIGPMAEVAEAGGGPDVRLVRMVISVTRAGSFYVNLDPNRAKIWRDTPEKPWKMRFEIYNNSPYDQLYWEIRYKTLEGVESEDYFGEIDIPCGVRNLEVEAIKTPEVAEAQWPYVVTVYACFNGEKGPEKATSTAPARIIWKD